MLPEVIRSGCGLPTRWRLDGTLWQKLLKLDGWASTEFQKVGMIPYPGLRVISGFRTRQQNQSVGGAPDSRHLTCPSTAVDLQFGSVAGISDQMIWAWFGARWQWLGGRWGGEFDDPNHFDLG